MNMNFFFAYEYYEKNYVCLISIYLLTRDKKKCETNCICRRLMGGM